MSVTLVGSSRPGHLAPGPINWRRAASYGALFAIATSALESFGLPLGGVSAAELLRFLAEGLPMRFLAGLLLAAAVMRFERRLSVAQIVLAFAGYSALDSALDWWSQQVFLPNVHPDRWWVSEQVFLHDLWSNVVYGGLFVTACRLGIRSENMRRMLAQAEITRHQSEALLSAARLQALQGRLDPAFLLRVMAEVESRYAHDAAGVDRLLDALVGLLRVAMPGVRSGASTLAAEVALATHYAQVWAELEPSRATWNIVLEGAMPDLPFPALLLLPLLDQVIAAPKLEAGAELLVHQGPRQCTLSIHCAVARPMPWMAPDLLHRLQLGLRALFGDQWGLVAGESPAAPVLVLTLPLGRPALTAAPMRNDTFFPTPDHKEISHE